MGVPGLAVTIYQAHKDRNVIAPYDDRPSQALYLDTNCLIHPVCMKVYNDNKHITDNDRLEEKMIHAVIDYIELIIGLIRPSHLVYIAIDGVAPMAKIKHQRHRRFKSVKDFEVKSNIAKKYNVDFPKPWNNSAITPGTVFMKKLTKAILYHMQGKAKTDSPVEYIFSSCNTPSEGEHKILQHVKKNTYKSKIIYGLDADLIYLALACNQSNICLLRETAEFQRNTPDGFSLLDIDVMKMCLMEEIGHSVQLDKFIRDYIFIGFFLGNDFLPPIPSVNFKFTKETLNGHNILLKCYKSIFEGEYLLTDDKRINMKYFMKFLEKLVAYEEPYFRESAQQRNFVRPCESSGAFEQEVYRLENLMFKVHDPIELGKENVTLQVSKDRYYHYYHMTPNKAIEKYFEGIQWTLKYYFNKCPDWLWFYPYDASPFISDIYEYLKTHTIKKAHFIDGYKSIKPLQQLLMVLPQQSKYLLPKSYQDVMTKKLKDYYPIHFEIDLVMKRKYWQGIPMVPMINPWDVIRATEEIPLSKEEELRNRFQLEFKIMI